MSGGETIMYNKMEVRVLGDNSRSRIDNACSKLQDLIDDMKSNTADKDFIFWLESMEEQIEVSQSISKKIVFVGGDNASEDN